MSHRFRYLLKKLLPQSVHQPALEDFEEAYAERLQHRGWWHAQCWLWGQVVGLYFQAFTFSPGRFLSLVAHAGYVAARRLRRDRLSMLVHVGGLSVGFAVFVVALGYLVQERGFDTFHRNSERIVRVIYEQHYPNQMVYSAVSPAPVGPALVESNSEVIDYCRFSRLFGEVLLAHGEDKRFYETGGVYADPSFFTLFSFDLLQGDASRALTDPTAIVLSRSLAMKYFGDADPMGQTMILEGGLSFTVTGIMAEVPVQSHLQFDFVIPFEILTRWGADLQSWDNWQSQYTYLLLRDESSLGTLSAKLDQMVVDHLPDHPHRLRLQRLADIHLARNIAYDGYAVIGEPDQLALVMLVAILVLAISVINAMNLATVRALRRAKEAGLRKVMGASRRLLGFHFGIESVALTALAMVMAFLWVALALPLLDAWIALPLIRLLGQPIFGLGVGLGLMLTAAGAGLYPALLFGRLAPQQLMRGYSPKGHRRWGLREGLVILQFLLSVVLIVFMLVVGSQLHYMESKDPGLRRGNLVYTQLRGGVRRNFDALKTQLLQVPGVLSVSGGGSFSSLYSKTTKEVEWPGKLEGDSQKLYTAMVDFDYLETFGIKVVEGRDFSPDRTTDQDEAFLVNETACKVLGFDHPLGTTLSFNGETGQVIGIVEDYHFLPLSQAMAPLIISVRQAYREFLFIRLAPENHPEIQREIHRVWDNLAPNTPLELRYWSDTYAQGYRPQRALNEVFRGLSVLAIMLASLGLVGLAVYAGQQRRREVAVRKVLGASSMRITVNLLGGFARQVGVATLLAWPLAAIAAQYWLSGFAYRTPLKWWMFILSGLVALVVAMLTVGTLAIQTARKPPTRVLRQVE